jgi:hypothetical protein
MITLGVGLILITRGFLEIRMSVFTLNIYVDVSLHTKYICTVGIREVVSAKVALDCFSSIFIL